MTPRTDFPPIRACIFDMDGLLINSEDLYTKVTNTILHENGRPDLPWSIKAQLQGRPGPSAGKILFDWAKLPISEAQFLARQRELQADLFRDCKALPGVEALLGKLGSAKVGRRGVRGRVARGEGVKLAVATSSHRGNFEIKTKRLKELFSVFPEEQVVVGDDERVPRGRGKPLPDIYLLALQVINDRMAESGGDERPVKPEECLVFEDSVPGVEAGRRAGMRVVWCPHPGLLEVYQDRIPEVLAGRTGEHKESDLNANDGAPLAGSPGHVGEIDDGWAEFLNTLEDFDYVKYAIEVEDERYRSESGQPAKAGTTDKELEEMCAKADGKIETPTGSAYNSPRLGAVQTSPKM